MTMERWRARTPNCDVVVDESNCIVLVDNTTGERHDQPILTVTNVAALVSALLNARTMVRIYEDHPGLRHLSGGPR